MALLTRKTDKLCMFGFEVEECVADPVVVRQLLM